MFCDMANYRSLKRLNESKIFPALYRMIRWENQKNFDPYKIEFVLGLWTGFILVHSLIF